MGTGTPENSSPRKLVTLLPSPAIAMTSQTKESLQYIIAHNNLGQVQSQSHSLN